MFLGQSDMLDINDNENDNHKQENESDTNSDEKEVLGERFVILSHR